MSTISPISTGSTRISDANTPTTRVPQKVLGQNDFLKLLAVQFKSQDPMKPMEDTAFIAQMAQFSSLEQSSSLAKNMIELRADQQRVTANSYLGHRVSVKGEEGQTVTGDVTAVDVSGSEPKLIVGEKPYSLSAVLRVEPGIVSAPASQPANTGGA